MTEVESHGEVVEDTLTTRVHDGKEVLRCTRCNTMVPRDKPEKFEEVDCDHNKEMAEKIGGGLAGL